MKRKIQNDDYNTENEEVLFAVKEHPWYFSKFILLTTIALVIALAYENFFGVNKTFYWIAGMLLIILAVSFLYIYFKWSKTQYLLTNQRVISFEQDNLFKRVMKEAMLENILFISNEVEGPINNLLECGSVHIRASGVTEDEIVFHNVYNPYELQKRIADAQKKYTKTSAQNVTEEEVEETEKEIKEKKKVFLG